MCSFGFGRRTPQRLRKDTTSHPENASLKPSLKAKIMHGDNALIAGSYDFHGHYQSSKLVKKSDN